MTAPITSVVDERTNAALIARHVRPLWVRDDDLVLDVTHGDGRWWDVFRPARFVAMDLYKGPTVADFRSLPVASSSVDVVAFDPPYIPQGGRDTSTMPDFLDRYGLWDVPKTTEGLFALFSDGMAEVARVLAVGGRALVKCMDFVNGAQYESGLLAMVEAARKVGLELEDVFVHVTANGARPKVGVNGEPRRQMHSWRTHSYLLVFVNGRRAWQRKGPEPRLSYAPLQEGLFA